MLLVFVALGSAHLFGIPALAARDEPRHIAYAIEIAEGELPNVRDRVQLKKLHAKKIKGTRMMAAAAHPPLYYALVGWPLKWASQGESLVWGMWLARGITLLMSAAGLAYAYLAARLLAPRSLALATTAFCALMPAFVNVSALVHNDALACLTTTALLHAVLLVLREGPRRRHLVAVAIWAALGASTRFSSLIVIGPALAATCLALLLRGKPSWPVRLRNAVLVGAGMLAIVLLTSGWFYLRSYRLYGDVTAGKALFEGLRREAREPFLQVVVVPDLWVGLVADLWGTLAGGVRLGGGVTVAGVLFFFGGLVLALPRAALAIRARGRDWWRSPGVGALVFVIIATLSVVLPIFEFFSRGGRMTARYYFPMLWAPLLAVAAGYGGFKNPLPGVAALLFAAAAGLRANDMYFEAMLGRFDRNFSIARAFARAGLPAPDWLAAGLVAAFAVGLGLITLAWLELRAIERKQAPAPVMS